MLSVVLSMLLILLVSGLVVTYVAWPHRGRSVPHAPWLGEAMRSGVRRAPLLEDAPGRRRDRVVG